MNYEKRFDLIRNLIDKTFPNYKKEHAINLINDTYQVIFVIPGGTFSLTVLVDSEWHKIKNKFKIKLKVFLLQNVIAKFVLIKLSFKQFIVGIVQLLFVVIVLIKYY